MKTRILFSTLLTVIFLVAFSGCNITNKTGTQSSFAGRTISTDSNYSDYTDETILNDNVIYNSGGKTVSYSEETPDGYTTDGTLENNSYYDDEEVLNENPSTEDADLETFENSLASDGQFVNITEEEIDPDNNVSGETVKCDEDVYTTVIWIPSSNYHYAGWHPYTNGRWVWSRYGWMWKSYYRWGSTYHYGRWWYSHRYGWVWSPGRKWSLGWVIWGHHKKYAGWYPISPRIKIHKKGPITPIIPRKNQNGWIIVKKNDFTKDVNGTTIITGTKRNDIIKSSTPVITLKNDANMFYNENTNVKVNEKVQVNTKQKSNNNKNADSEIKTVVKETQKKITENKNKITQTSTLNTKQISTVKNEKSNIVEKKTQVNNNQEKKNVTVTSTPNNKQNNTVTNKKSNTTENKNVIKENKKKTVETPTVSVEKTGNKSSNTKTSSNNNNTKTSSTNNNTVNNTKKENTNNIVNTAPKVDLTPKVPQTPKVEQTPKVQQSPKVEQTPKVQQTPKVEQTPKVNKEPVKNTQQNNTNVKKSG